LAASLAKRMATTIPIPIWFDGAHSLHAGSKMHPESPTRLDAIIGKLKSDVDQSKIKIHYKLDSEVPLTIQFYKEGRSWRLVDGDTYETKYTHILVSRGREMITDAVASKSRVGFVLIRPPGHHASADGAAGFCHFNNVWYAGQVALTAGYKNIVILDWDAHHGDGTENHVKIAKDPRIKFVSLHAYGDGIYPGSGGKSNILSGILNIPLEQGTGPKEYLEAFTERVLPFMCEDWKPDLVLVSAGYDAHKDDPMGLMNLEDNTYRVMSSALKDIGCNVLFMLEGGYNPAVLANCVVATLEPWF
jgi:acetoin utilization deacetylase AcuC-like enzyme